MFGAHMRVAAHAEGPAARSAGRIPACPPYRVGMHHQAGLHRCCERGELLFELVQTAVILAEIGHHPHVRRVEHQRSIALVRLGHGEVRGPDPRARAGRTPRTRFLRTAGSQRRATEKCWRCARLSQDPRGHGSDGGLAAGPGHSNVASRAEQLDQHLGTAAHDDARLASHRHIGHMTLHGAAHHHRIDLPVAHAAAVLGHQLHTGGLKRAEQLLVAATIVIAVRAAHRHPAPSQHQRQRTHAAAADSHQMNALHGNFSSSWSRSRTAG